MSDVSLAIIAWDGPVPPPEIMAIVREDMADNLSDCESTTDLGFHVIPLKNDDYDGPTVVVFGTDVEGHLIGVWSEKETEHYEMDVTGSPKLPDGTQIKTVSMPEIVKERLG